MEVQICTQIRRDWSFISEAAIKVGEDVLEVGARGAFAINGVEGSIETKKQTEKDIALHDLGSYPLTYSHWGTKRHTFKINLGNKQKLVVKIYNECTMLAKSFTQVIVKW